MKTMFRFVMIRMNKIVSTWVGGSFSSITYLTSNRQILPRKRHVSVFGFGPDVLDMGEPDGLNVTLAIGTFMVCFIGERSPNPCIPVAGFDLPELGRSRNSS